jgi:transposase
MRRDGSSFDDIAERFGISRSTAYNWTRDVVDLPRTPRRGRREEQVRAARSLRQEGCRYSDIAARLGVSVATVHGWTADVSVRTDHQRDLGGRTRAERRETSRRAWEPRVRAAAVRRQQTKLAAANEVGGRSDRDLFIAGLTAYWAEGTKDKDYRRQERIIFTNSDPLMIQLFRDWLDLMGVAAERRRYRVSIHETADVQAAERYWADILQLPEVLFQRAPSSATTHGPTGCAPGRVTAGVWSSA